MVLLPKAAVPALLVFGQLRVVSGATNQYETWAESALQELQSFYDESTGLWRSFAPSWWQSANALTTLADMVALNSSAAKTVAASVIPNTFKEAAAFNQANNHNTKRADTTTPWTNGYYDDEGWWAMAWISAYDVTNNSTYLQAAEGLFGDMTTGWGTNCTTNGMWWNKAHTEINPIANVLFMETAAYLAKRVPAKQSTYIDWATKDWTWLKQSGMWNGTSHIVSGGIDVETCQPTTSNRGWTYAQGTLIQALTVMSEVTGDAQYLTQAENIADAVIAMDTVNGILVEPGISSNPPGDQPSEQFKGVFMRGLRRLYQSSPLARYQTFAENNAQSIWANPKQQQQRSGVRLAVGVCGAC